MRVIGSRLKFGYYDIEDLEQEAWIWAQEALPNYDGRTRLFNFLYTTIKRRIFNLRREKLERLSPPCEKCPINAFLNKRCTAFEDLFECTYYAGWAKRNTAKKSLASPNPIFDFCDTGSPPLNICPVEHSDMMSYIHKILTPEEAAILKDIMAGKSVPKVKFLQIEQIVKECVSDESDEE